ncbi:ABC transporter permease [Bradyrhizobium tropiciagri]|uniref:ABC transporter permease n=1 Tax=Bradyrhizobium tropiciagri TaxID=312253 RepID=UPI001BA5F2EF|nr:ABC transporter permease [Bradyrhizobium tropiciagri]MBR0869418.1 ABC transporter permease [Bradyrhizobium tropiciagri]
MRSMLSRAAAAFNAPALATAVALLGLWEVGVRTATTRFEFLPAPSEIGEALYGAIRSGQIIGDSMHTVACAVAGWIVASALGAAIGLALAFSPMVRRFFGTSLELLRPLPAVAFVPVAVLLFGFTVTTEITVIVFASVWPVIVNTVAGAKAIHPRLLDTAATLHLSRMQRLGKIVLPAVLPSAMVGARVALGLALVVAVIAEMVGNPAGLGWGVVTAQEALQPGLMFGYLVATGALGVLLNACLRASFARLFPGIRELAQS